MDINVNLRDELLESKGEQDAVVNSRISDTKMLLADNEANRIQVLKALGLDEGIQEYEDATRRSLDRKQFEEDYGKDIFHSDEIKALCLKYDLRLLNTKFYNGSITSELPDKVVDFAKKHDVKVGVGGDTWSGDGDKFYILAPRDKFKPDRSKSAKERDKDPILFFATDRGYYKMVYAWGSSLKMFRLLKGWRRRNSRNRYIFVVSLLSTVIVPLLGFAGLALFGSLLIGVAISSLAALIFMPWDEGIDTNSDYYTENGWQTRRKITLL